MAKVPTETQLAALAKDLNSKTHVEVTDAIPETLVEGDVAVVSGQKITGDMIASGTIKSDNVDWATIGDKIYPVGICVPFYDNNDHSNFLGLEWERTMKGRVPVGIESGSSDFGAIGKTGGVTTVTLTVEQIPSHTHLLTNLGTTSGDINGSYMNVGGYATYPRNISGATGGGQSHTNLQPYEVVAWWKRTA